MKISVIMAVYNGEKYLKEAVCSVLRQPYKNIEIIIVDDGSIDNTFSILKEMKKKDERIHIIHQKNSGVSAARNRGMDLARGEYIVFLDADDIWVKDFLTDEVVSEIKKDNYDLISFGYYEGNEKLSRVRYREREKRIVIDPKNNIGENYRSICSYFCKREFLNRIQIYWYGKRCEDERFRLECLYKASKMLYLPIGNFIYRNNNQSTTHQSDRKQAMLDVLSVYQKWEKECKDDELKQLCRDTKLHNFLEFLQVISADKNINDTKFIKYEKEYNFNQMWNNHGWLSENDKNAWNLYLRDKQKFAKKYRGRELKIDIVQKLKKIQLINNLYEKRKYPLKWGDDK